MKTSKDQEQAGTPKGKTKRAKLNLNKETVEDLSAKEPEQVKGGAYTMRACGGARAAVCRPGSW